MNGVAQSGAQAHRMKGKEARRMQKNRNRRAAPVFTDQGPEPYTVNIERAALLNSNFRTALWTGEHLQATLMSIPEQIGLEAHPTLDQFLKIVDGTGLS